MSKDFKKFAKSKNISSLSLHNFNASLTPYITEEREMNIAQIDVFSRLMMERIIFIGTEITNDASNIIQAQLLYLDSIKSDKPIKIYINSPGGGVYSALGIYDTIQYIKSDVSTICTGLAASAAALLLCSGTKGQRSALPHSRIMIHQPIGGIDMSQASDIEITAKEIVKLKGELFEIIAKHTNQPIEKIVHDGDRDYWMTASEAKDYGMIDSVLERGKRKK